MSFYNVLFKKELINALSYNEQDGYSSKKPYDL